MMRAQHQDRRLLEITPPRIAPFVKHGNDFGGTGLFRKLKHTVVALLALPDSAR
jgi:hypothetical protein